MARRHAAPAAAGRAAREVVGAGVIAGVIGGAPMLLWAMVYAASEGLGFWTPAKAIAATFLGAGALGGGGGAIVLGVALHAIASTLWGVLGAWALGRETGALAALLLGLVAGLVVLTVMTFVVLSVFDRVMLDRVRLMWGMWVTAHLVFGAGLASAPWLRRRLARPLAPHGGDGPAAQ